jgi:ABC-type transport system involved in cytochrome c biogenesis permease component
MTRVQQHSVSALAWAGRTLAVLLGVLLLAVIVPALHLTCEAAKPCDGWLNARGGYLLIYALLISAPVAMVFAGRGSRRWVGAVGWGMLLLAACVVLL